MWIDTFVEFVSGEKASAVKNISLAEDYLHDHFPGYPVFPVSLMIEGMAQTAGILVGESRGFKENVILAKIRKASFREYGRPGDQLRYDAIVDSLDDQAATTSGTVLRNGKEIGQVDLIFSHVNQATKAMKLPEHNFVFGDSMKALIDSVRATTKMGDES